MADDNAPDATVTETPSETPVNAGVDTGAEVTDKELDADFANAVDGKSPVEKKTDKPTNVEGEGIEKIDKPEGETQTDEEKAEAERLAAEQAEKAEQEKADAEKLKQEQEKAKEQGKGNGFDSGKFVKDFVESFPLKEFTLPDGSKTTLKDFSESYPEFATILPLMALQISNDSIDRMLAGKEVPTMKEFMEMKSFIDEVKAERFDTGLNAKFAGASDILKSEAFSKWAEKQPKSISAMRNSDKADDRVYVAKMFANETKMAEQKKKTVDLHRGNLKPVNPVKPKTEGEEEDVEAIWKEAIK